MNTINQSKLIDHLKLLDRQKLVNDKKLDEVKLFQKWLDSPWVNAKEDSKKLFKILLKFYPRFDQPNLSKAFLHRKLFVGSKKDPSEKNEDKKVRQYMSNLLKEIRQFLIYQQFHEDQDLQQRLLMKSYQERSEPNLAEKLAITEKDKIKKRVSKDENDYLHLTEINKLLYHQPVGTIRHTPGTEVLKDFESNLDKYYIFQKSIILNEHLGRVNILNEVPMEKAVKKDQKSKAQVGKKNLQTVINNIKKTAQWLSLLHLESEDPAIQWNMANLLNNTNNEEQSFQNFKDIRRQLTASTKKIFLIWLINDASSKLNNGDNTMLPHLFELFKFGIEESILIHNQTITDRTYSNVVTIANLNQGFDYAFSFINEYTTLLPLIYQEDANTWASAHTFYNLGNLEACIELIGHYPFKHHSFKIQGNILLLQAHYDNCLRDRTNYDLLFHLAEAFEKRLRRDTILSQNRKRAALNFINYLRQIIKPVMIGYDQKNAFRDILKKLKQEKNIIAKKWFMEKLG